MAIAINAGSSSVKAAAFTFESAPQELDRTSIDAPPAEATGALRQWLERQAERGRLDVIGHRLVHGGPVYMDPVRITEDVLVGLKQLIPFAPNHLPDEIELIEGLRRAYPAIPHVACFDTAFHRDMSDVARRLPIPAQYDREGVRRYGFHGLSYAFLLEELARLEGRPESGGAILAHLGNGSSLAAVDNGRSVDTTMAFTPIAGIVMSTRSGDLDPGVVTHLMRREHLTPDQAEDLLSHRSGLLGISDVTGDMRTLLVREADDAGCRLAVASYVYSIKKCIGAFAAALGRLDTLVFSGGIGEHASVIRERICRGLAFLGVELDQQLNAAHAPVISRRGAAATVRVIPTNEELMIARMSFRLLAQERP